MATKTMTKPRSTATKSAQGSKSTTGSNKSTASNSRTGNGGSAAKSTSTNSRSTNGTSRSSSRQAISGSNGASTATMTMTKPSARANSKTSRATAMSDKAMAGKEFKKFFIDEMKDIYWAEKHLAKALPKMKRAATSEQLKAAFDKHTTETQGHISVVEKIFAALGEKPKTKKCEAMEGILAECNSIIKDTEKNTFVRDASLILGAQKAEHYEIATYGTLRIFAQYLKNKRVTTMLEGILNNEKYTDVSLTKLAEGFINDRAAQE